jgi:TolB protein
VGTSDVWSFDLERGLETRITSEVGDELAPLGLRDGRRLVYSAARGGSPQLYIRDLTTAERVGFPEGGSFQQAQDISPDGRTATPSATRAASSRPGHCPLRPGQTVLLLQSPFQIAQVRFSPDGRFVAFVSAESGRPGVRHALPGPGEKTRVDGRRPPYAGAPTVASH